MQQLGFLIRVDVLKAELKRSFVDFFNHFTLLFSNQVKKDSYLNKLKNIIIFFPSILFFASGVQTIYHISNSIQTGEVVSELPPMSLVPIVAYIATIAIESVVIYKNIKDVVLIKEKKKNLTFLEKFRLIFQVKKNPVLMAILTENFITFSSTLIPIVCYGMFYAYQNIIWNIMGGYVIGSIQVFFNKLLWIKIIFKKFKRYIRLVSQRNRIQQINQLLK